MPGIRQTLNTCYCDDDDEKNEIKKNFQDTQFHELLLPLDSRSEAATTGMRAMEPSHHDGSRGSRRPPAKSRAAVRLLGSDRAFAKGVSIWG